ncbi:MAG: hypothetical protein ACKPHU_19920 [Planctomycetaceae bacterium]
MLLQIRIALSIIVGFFVGSLVNMLIVGAGPSIIPLPPGSDSSSIEKLRESVGNYEAKHFLFPLLAHALGTLTGSAVAGRFAGPGLLQAAIISGVLFLAGGIAMDYLVKGPTWYRITDLTVCYLPMTLIACGLEYNGRRRRTRRGR